MTVAIFFRTRNLLEGNNAPQRMMRSSAEDHFNRKIHASRVLMLEVEYSRHLINAEGIHGSSSSAASSVGYKLRANLKDRDSHGATGIPGDANIATKKAVKSKVVSEPDLWDLEVPIDLSTAVRCQGGQCFLGVVGSGIVFQPSEDEAIGARASQSSNFSLLSDDPGAARCLHAFHADLLSLAFKGRGALSAHPVASPFTTTRFPDTFLRIETEVNQFRAWMNLKLQVQLPKAFKVVFDPETVICYERIFSLIMKVGCNPCLVPKELCYGVRCLRFD